MQTYGQSAKDQTVLGQGAAPAPKSALLCICIYIYWEFTREVGAPHAKQCKMEFI